MQVDPSLMQTAYFGQNGSAQMQWYSWFSSRPTILVFKEVSSIVSPYLKYGIDLTMHSLNGWHVGGMWDRILGSGGVVGVNLIFFVADRTLLGRLRRATTVWRREVVGEGHGQLLGISSPRKRSTLAISLAYPILVSLGNVLFLLLSSGKTSGTVFSKYWKPVKRSQGLLVSQYT